MFRVVEDCSTPSRKDRSKTVCNKRLPKDLDSLHLNTFTKAPVGAQVLESMYGFAMHLSIDTLILHVSDNSLIAVTT